MKISKTVDGALSRVESVLSKQAKVVSEIDRARIEFEAAETRLQNALEKLGMSEAGAVLGEVQAPDEKLRRAVRDRRDDLEAQGARIQGLTNALKQTETEIVVASEEMAAAYESYFVESLERCASELRVAATSFAPAVRKCIAVTRALGRRSDLEDLRIVNPARESEELIEIVARNHDGTTWGDDLEADSSVAAVRTSFERIQREANRISAERASVARARAEADAEARLASGPRYQAREIDYSGAPAEPKSQVAARPN